VVNHPYQFGSQKDDVAVVGHVATYPYGGICLFTGEEALAQRKFPPIAVSGFGCTLFSW
jgi:hypothetical protein